MTSQGQHADASSARSIPDLLAAEMAAREMGGLPLLLCELLADAHSQRYERGGSALARTVHQRAGLPPLAEVALVAAALAELRHGKGSPESKP
jgi:hypothetical protein